VEVSDQGKGFDSQIDMFGPRTNGFGLWSVADRAQELGGHFTVETSLGRGSRFELVFPLGATQSADRPRTVSTGSKT
jgi:signal transduction histidine kinase